MGILPSLDEVVNVLGGAAALGQHDHGASFVQRGENRVEDKRPAGQHQLHHRRRRQTLSGIAGLPVADGVLESRPDLGLLSEFSFRAVVDHDEVRVVGVEIDPH